jgi:CcmD family protein
MSSFVITYVLFWLAVTLYVVRLGSRQRKLQNRLLALQAQLQVNPMPITER